MFCNRCGKQNPEGATRCAHCDASMAAPAPLPFRPRTSGMAVASLVLGILGMFMLAIPSLVGLPLGIASLVRINRSAGRLRGQGLAIAGICVSGFAVLMLPILAAMLFPVFARARESARKAQCVANLQHISIALQMYAMDWDERLPGAAGWCDRLTEYGLPTEAFACPSEPRLPCGYAYNSELSGADLMSLSDPATTVTVFESDRGWNAAGQWEILCPVPRHLGGDSYLYADGHYLWLERDPLPGPAVPPG